MSELILNPYSSINRGVSVRTILGPKMADTPSPSPPNEPTLSDAREADAIKAALPSSENCTLIKRESSTYVRGCEIWAGNLSRARRSDFCVRRNPAWVYTLLVDIPP